MGNTSVPVTNTPLTGTDSSLPGTDTPLPKTMPSVSNADYCAINPRHTICVYKGPSDACSGKTILRGMTNAGKAATLAKHNELRRRVAKDEELEAIAQRWADQCTFEHDETRGRTMLDGTRIGQNLHISPDPFEMDQDGLDAAFDSIVQGWYNEVGLFDSSNINQFAFSQATGH